MRSDRLNRYHHVERSTAETIRGAVDACRRMLIGISETPSLDARVLALTRRRAAGEPVAYLVGEKEFCGLRLRVDKRVLVPRPETEEVVLAIVEDWRRAQASILDLGTGSGAIACALAHMLPLAHITATDSSAAALEVARANVEQLGLSERIALLAGDLFEPLMMGQTYDVIVANLPYVATSDAALAADVRAHEPHTALFGGADGLDIYRRLLPDAPAHLRTNGRVYLECGPANARALREIAQAAFPQRSVSVHEDAGGRQRYVRVA